MKVLILNTKQPIVPRSWGEENIEQFVIEALQEGGCDVYNSYAENEKQADKSIAKINPDIVFPNGYVFLDKKNTIDENTIYISEFLENLDIPYVGSPAEIFKSCFPKESFKKLLRNLSIPTPNFVIAKDKNFDLNGLAFPVITKLNFGAESIGVLKISDEITLEKEIKKLLEQYKQSIIIEQWHKAKEYTVGVLGNPPDRFIMPLEVKIPQGFFYMEHFLKSNHMLDSIQTIDVPEVKLKIQQFILNVSKKLNIRDWARFDILEKNGEFLVIDLNFLPGLRKESNISYYPVCTEKNLNLNYTQTVNMILYSALTRYDLQPPIEMENLLGIKHTYGPG